MHCPLSPEFWRKSRQSAPVLFLIQVLRKQPITTSSMSYGNGQLIHSMGHMGTTNYYTLCVLGQKPYNTPVRGNATAHGKNPNCFCFASCYCQGWLYSCVSGIISATCAFVIPAIRVARRQSTAVDGVSSSYNTSRRDYAGYPE